MGALTAPRKTRSIWKAWLPTIFWLVAIAFESTSVLSAANTGKILYPVFHFLFGMDLVHFLTWHFVLRKSGHVVGYGVLSLLLYRAWRATIPVRGDPRWSIVWSMIAFCMTGLVASLDEWHQTFLPSRSGSIHDVLLDSTAGLGAQIALFLWIRGWHTQEPTLLATRTSLPTPSHERPARFPIRD